MKAQRPSGQGPRALPPSLKFGETGETWGNLRVPGEGLPLDQRFFFEDDAAKRVFQVTRLYRDPLEPAKSLAFYEAVARDPWPSGS